MNQILIPAAKRECSSINRYYPAWQIPDFQRDGWDIYLEEHKDKHFDRLLIKVPGRPRTTGRFSQGNHINGHCQQVAHQTGNDFDTIKMMMKYGAISENYPIDTAPDGRAIPWSEARINTMQAKILIDYIHRWAAENDILLVEDELGLL